MKRPYKLVIKDGPNYNIDEKDETWVWTLREEERAGELSFNKLVETLTGSSPTALIRKTLTAIRKDGWILGPADGGRTFYKEIEKK